MMKVNSKIELKLKGLDNLRAGLKEGQYVKVGVFGNHKSQRTDNSINNVELAVIQNFGSISNNIPARPFIDMPLREKRADILKYAASPTMRNLLLTGDVKKALGLLGVFAENIIQKAFDTSGFGKWAPNSPVTIRLKGSDKPLVDSGQLRRAVTSEVVA